MVDCIEGAVRLKSGSNSREGIVEICYRGHWFSVCGKNWSEREAEVVCRQLNLLTTSISKINMAL